MCSEVILGEKNFLYKLFVLKISHGGLTCLASRSQAFPLPIPINCNGAVCPGQNDAVVWRTTTEENWPKAPDQANIYRKYAVFNEWWRIFSFCNE